jgi:hypothetical protein
MIFIERSIRANKRAHNQNASAIIFQNISQSTSNIIPEILFQKSYIANNSFNKIGNEIQKYRDRQK